MRNTDKISDQVTVSAFISADAQRFHTAEKFHAPLATPHLTYVSDTEPGIARRQHGRYFRYVDHKGKLVADEKTRERIRSLVIPPAWTNVWVCSDASGHIQATGRDAKGRKQYIYHPDFRAARESSKYLHLVAFGNALPSIRARVSKDMSRAHLDQLKVFATIVFLLEATMIRIGNSEYARTNRSYGITTLRNPHVEVEGSSIKFKFRGKSGKMWNVRLSSRRAANVIRACQELPGQLLFQYESADGTPLPVTSTDINQYLRDITERDITAKDYRTWAGTVLAAKLLHDMNSEAGNRKKVLTSVIKQVAEQLGNTPSICRKCYIHPYIQEQFLAGTFKLRLITKGKHGTLDPYERAVLSLLKRSSKKAEA